jgi:hypothetical protein
MICLVSFVFAISSATASTGTIRIDPALPLMIGSPADFEVWVQGAGDPTFNPHILLVITEECKLGLAGDIVVTWDGGSLNIAPNEFIEATDKFVPPMGATSGARYTVASLKDHIGTEGPIFWAMGSILEGPIHTSPRSAFTVTIDSNSTRVLVYVMGMTDSACGLFDTRVPPTIPGFVVPEVGTLLLTLAPLGAFGLYAFKRRRS